MIKIIINATLNFVKAFGFLLFLGLNLKASSLEVPLQKNFILQNSESIEENQSSYFSQFKITEQKIFQFYQLHNFQEVWSQNKELSIAGRAALKTLRNAYTEGIENLSESEMQEIETTLSSFEASDKEKLLCDIKLTKSIIKYIDDLYGQRSNMLNLTENELKLRQEKLSHSEAVYKNLFHIPYAQDLLSINITKLSEIKKNIISKTSTVSSIEILTDGLQKDSTGQWLIELTIPHLGYQKLKKVLEIWHKFIEQNIKLQRSLELNEFNLMSPLNENQFKEQLCYLTDTAIQDSSILSQDFLIKKFQAKCKIPITGKLDHLTLTTLFNEILLKYKQILITMEQWRTLPLNLGAKYIFVNIPNFTLSAFDMDRKILEMPVIIGTSYRPTPVIETKIDRITFNPVWYVPQSIAVKDKLPLLKRNPAYFNQKNYEIFDAAGQSINPVGVNWSSINTQNFKYKIIQKAGSDNALGKLFFHINTPYGIYLHGTSQNELFAHVQRSLSSGCIRLKDPEALAKFVLATVVNEPSHYIQSHLIDKKTFTILVNPTLSVYIIYHSVWIDDYDQVHFEKDIYNKGKFFQQILPLSFPPTFFTKMY